MFYYNMGGLLCQSKTKVTGKMDPGVNKWIQRAYLEEKLRKIIYFLTKFRKNR